MLDIKAGFEIYLERHPSHYSGEDFEQACRIAKRKRSKVWENPSRNHWIVNAVCPPHLFEGGPDDRWHEV